MIAKNLPGNRYPQIFHRTRLLPPITSSFMMASSTSTAPSQMSTLWRPFTWIWRTNSTSCLQIVNRSVSMILSSLRSQSLKMALSPSRLINQHPCFSSAKSPRKRTKPDGRLFSMSSRRRSCICRHLPNRVRTIPPSKNSWEWQPTVPTSANSPDQRSRRRVQ